MRELRQLKEQVALSADAAELGGAAEQEDAGAELAVQQLANMLVALSGHVSLLHERLHEALLSQVLGIELWTAPQVRSESCPVLVTLWPCPCVDARSGLWDDLRNTRRTEMR